MSYILDALKKVEHEKIRKASATGMTSISGDLFQERVVKPSGGSTGKIIVVLVLVALLTFIVTWFMLKGDKKKIAAVPQEIPAAVATPATPSKQDKPVTAAALPPLQTPSLLSPAAAAPVSPQPTTATRTIAAPADIKVTGIAWQDERAARRAVVNGLLMQEGTVVSGATILEITPDRVTFKSPAGTFDVRMDAAALPGTSSK